jgi:Bacterial Ig-like domain (group 2)
MAPPWFTILQPDLPMSALTTLHLRRAVAARVAAALMMAVGVVSCVGGSDAVAPCALSGIAVSPATTTLSVGQTMQAVAEYSVQNCLPPALTWTSDSTRVATVSSSGLITAVAVGGPAVIRVSAAGQTGRAQVTVVAASVAQQRSTEP